MTTEARHSVNLSYAQTVPGAIAHRAAVSEVLVTDSAQLSDQEFAVGLQPPRGHSLWGDRRNGFHDPMAVAEGARQAAFVVLHRHLGVPVGLPFTLHRYDFFTDDLTAFEDDGRTPLNVRLEYRLTRLDKMGDAFGGLSLAGEAWVGGRRALVVNGDVAFLSPDDHEALRAFQRTHKPLGSEPVPDSVRRVEPAAVGRWDERNVTIGESPGQESRFVLLPDLSHPSFFDHAYDHVPGPFIVESFRQSAVRTARRAGLIASPVVALTGCEVSFTQFGEFGDRLECSVAPEPAGSATRPDGVALGVTLHQYGEKLAEGRIELAPFPEHTGEV